MNITFVSDAIYPYNKGGKEKRLYELSTRMAALGHDVHIYTMHWWKSTQKVRVENGVTLHAICKYQSMYAGDRRSIKEGVLFGLACFKLLFVKFEVLDVDHMPFFPIYSAWIVCVLKRKKLFGTWHEALSRQDWTNYMGRPGIIAYAIEHLSIKLPSRIISSSLHTKKMLLAYHGRKRHVSVVSPGIDSTFLQAVKQAKKRIDVLYVGRLVKDKGVDKLIAAFALLAQKDSALRCVIIGHGIEKNNLQKQIKQLRIERQVIMLEPFETDKEIYAHMKAAKVFCLPSVREGFGIVALEALGCGTPVITTNAAANAAKDLLKNPSDGTVIQLDTNNLKKTLSSRLKIAKKSTISSNVASYDWNTLTHKLVKVYAS